MKMLMGICFLLLFASTCFADQNVSGYVRQDGTYVAPYVRSSPDSSYNNNYSTKGNTNPYTSESGTNSRTYNYRTPNYNNYRYPAYEKSYGGYGNSIWNKKVSHYMEY